MSNPISRIKKVGVSSEKDNFDNQIRQWFPIASLIGLAVGIVMAGFHVLIVMLTWIFQLPHPVFGMVLGGLIIIIIQYFKFENPDHNGITYVITKRHQEETIPIDVGVKKFSSSSLTIAAGLPVGREGPALIIGSSIATKIVEWTKVPEEFRHQAITVGSAAATGALFQAPFGSAVFSAEVPYKEDSDEGMLMSAFLASVIAAITASTLINFISKYKDVRFHILDIPEAKIGFTFQNAFLAIMLGILIGLVGRLFIEFYYWYSDKLIIDYSVHTKLIIGFSIFLSTMLLAFIIVPDLYLLRGVNAFFGIEELIETANSTTITFIIVAIGVQIIATTVIVGSGFPGGIFAPSLLIGALIATIFVQILNIDDPALITAWLIVGMSGSHASTTKTPVASVLLILEITGLPNLIIPMVLANISAYISSGPRSLYKGQLRSRDAAIFRHLKEYDQHEEYTVSDVMTSMKDVFHFHSYTLLSDVLETYKSSGKRDFPVILSEDDSKLIGILHEEEIVKIKDPDLEVTVEQIMDEKAVTVHENITGKDALTIMLDEDIERAPVVDDEGTMVGIVSIGDIIRGHKTLIEIKEITG